MKFKDLDVVVLLTDLPAEGLKAGEKGTIIDVFAKPREAYEVEFPDSQGRARAMVVVNPEQIRAA